MGSDGSSPTTPESASGVTVTGVDVHIRFAWGDPRPVTFDERDHLVIGELPDAPGVYRWTLSGGARDTRNAVYIGEGGSLRVRLRNYRGPSRMPTAGALHLMFVEHLRAGGRLTVEWATDAQVDPGSGGNPLARRSARRLVEGAAIAAEYAADRAEVLNRDVDVPGR